MRKYRNRILTGFGVALIIYVGLLLLLDSEGQLTEGTPDYLRAFPWHLVPALIFFQVMVIAFRFLEWHYYLGVIEARDKISLLDSFIIFVSGFVMVVSPGKVAEVLKAVLLKTRTGVPVAKSAPIVIAERVVDGIAVIAILVIVLLFAGDRLELGEYRQISQTLVFSSATILAFGLIVVQIGPLAYFILNIVAGMPVFSRLHAPLVEFYESSREIFRLRHVVPMIGLGMGVYASSSLGFMIVLSGFGLEISWSLLLQATFITGVAAAIGALSFVPNGAGVTELTNVGMLLAIVAPLNPVLTAPAAAAAALIQGFFHKWFRVLVGLVVASVYRRRLFSPAVTEAITEFETESFQKRTSYRVESSHI
jgi:uncharacterized protein (TIRG00374 family)